MTGMAETGVLLDGHGAPLGPALAWHDPRGDCDEVRARLGEQAYRRTAGRPIDAVSSLPKLLWLRRHVPETRRAVRFLSVPEWAVHTLGGDQVSELSLVSRTGLFDVPGRAPWLDALAMLDAGPSFLGEIVAAGQPVGRAGGSAPAELRGAVLTVAGHDHQTAAFALGAAVDGALFDSLGTAEALVRTVRAPLRRGSHRADGASGASRPGWGVVPDHLCLLAGLPTGISLERLGAMVGAPTPAERIELGRRALAVDRSVTAMRVSASYHGLTVHDVDDEADPGPRLAGGGRGPQRERRADPGGDVGRGGRAPVGRRGRRLAAQPDRPGGQGAAVRRLRRPRSARAGRDRRGADGRHRRRRAQPALARRRRPDRRRPLGGRRRDLPGPPRDEPGLDHHRAVRRRIPRRAAEELLGREPADGVRVLGDHRHRRVEHVGEQEVVEADQGHLVLPAEPAQGLQGADRHEVLRGEQRGRRLGRR